MTAKQFFSDPNGGLSKMMKDKTRPEGMSYKNLASMCKMAKMEVPSEEEFEKMSVCKASEYAEFMKGDDMEDEHKKGYMKGEDDESSEDEEDEESEEAEKSMSNQIAASDLLKSIAAYENIEGALAGSGESRESYLTARLDAGTISKSERSELGRIWAGVEEEVEEAAPVQKSLNDHLTDDEDAGHLVDASDFLKSLVQGVDYRMDQVLGEVSRDGRATRELMKAQGSILKSLATVVAEQDEIIKSLTNRVETVESAPVTRRAVTTDRGDVRTRSLNKSTAGGQTGDNLSKSEITSGLRALMVHAADSNDEGAMDRISHATALYEQTGSLPPNMATAIRQVV